MQDLMLTRETLTRQAFDALIKEIVDNRLQPGDSLPSTAELTEKFGISRPVVREALSALQACGFVDVRNGRNPIVGEFDGRLIQMFMARAARLQHGPMSGLMEVRIPLEIQAARLAAERATEADIREIDASNARMAAAILDTTHYPELDTNFHAEIATATGNKILIWMIASIRAELMAIMVAVRTYREINDLVGQEQKQHDDITLAIRDRDPTSAAAAMERHLLTSLDLVRKVEGVTLSDRPEQLSTGVVL
ncbi:MAG: FadR family transcriptional regulator [Microbacteriaceae bacterium]|nr:MAG: FadR family transcriptional regulator [Microbacteriaceae bacterium]